MKAVLLANRKGGCGKTLAAVTLASALAERGNRVALIDADAQKSAMRWLKRRPAEARPIAGVNWTEKHSVGDVPKGFDWLVIDAPGAIRSKRAEGLIAEAEVVIAPVMPSFFDTDSTKRFVRDIEDIKRIRKGKVALHLLANRVRPRQKGTQRLEDFFSALGQVPAAWITERAAYAELAAQGLAVFDRHQSAWKPMRAQWEPVVSLLE